MHRADRSWQDQWRTIMSGYMAIGRCYSGQHLDLPPEQVVHDFCRDCYQLRHYLETDPTVALSVQLAVEAHVVESSCISLTGFVAHPKYVGDTVIRHVVDQNPPRTTMLIEWKYPDGTTDSDDAFDVAAGAVGEWRTFLTRHNLV